MASEPLRPLSLSPDELNSIITLRLAVDGFSNDPEIEAFLRAEANSSSFALSPSETALIISLRDLRTRYPDKALATRLADARIKQAVDVAKAKLENGGWQQFGFDAAPPQASPSQAGTSVASGAPRTQSDAIHPQHKPNIKPKIEVKPHVPQASVQVPASAASSSRTSASTALSASTSSTPATAKRPSSRSVVAPGTASKSTSKKRFSKKTLATDQAAATSFVRLNMSEAKALVLKDRQALVHRGSPRQLSTTWRRNLHLFSKAYLSTLTTPASRIFLQAFNSSHNDIATLISSPTQADIDRLKKAIPILHQATQPPHDSELFRSWVEANMDGEVFILATTMRESVRHRIERYERQLRRRKEVSSSASDDLTSLEGSDEESESESEDELDEEEVNRGFVQKKARVA
ncbi:hypothetical protein BDY24DRAFT_181771 [Mrakia frigida]|uniref:uncharacterized protein n=1 Tax=Mrakia frigida TaxID=29902 RepID=UPI003FCBFE19